MGSPGPPARGQPWPHERLTPGRCPGVSEGRTHGLPHHHQIEPAIVVEVEEGGVEAHDAGERAAQAVTPGIALEGAVAAVMVQRGVAAIERRQKQVEEPVVVVVADRDRAGPPYGGEAARRRHVLEPPLTEVVEQPRVAIAREHHQIGAAVAVEIARGGVAAALHGQAHRRGHLAERAVEVVTVDAVSPRRREQEVEVAVMVHVREQRLRHCSGIGQAGGRGNVAKRSPVLVPEQHSPPRGRDVEVEPSVVVEIAERRRDRAVPERQPRAGAGFDEASEGAAEQVARDEQVFGLVVVVISHRQRHPALERARQAIGQRLHDLESAPRRHIGETDGRRDRPRIVARHGDVGVEREHRIAHECTGRAAQAFEGDLVGRGDLHGAMEPGRLRRGLCRPTGARQHEGSLEKARRLPGQLGELAL